MQFLSEGNFKIGYLSAANDTQLLANILRQEPLPEDIYCSDAGTVFRFMACLCASIEGKTFRLTGTNRLLNRPMDDLIDNLNQLGATVYFEYKDNQKCGLYIRGTKLNGTPLRIRGSFSSQFISGLCLIGHTINGGLDLSISTPILSKPYIDLTLNLLANLGIKSSFQKNRIVIPEQKITTSDIKVEYDWSSASFFYSLLLLEPNIRGFLLLGLDKHDLQGDKQIIHLCEQFGIKSQFETDGCHIRSVEALHQSNRIIDLSNYPDIAIPIIVAAAFSQTDIRFTGLEHLKYKESDRIKAIQLNLQKFGIELQEQHGEIWFNPHHNLSANKSIQINTFQDHRIAMSFSLLAVLGYEILLDDVKCIDKSFPGFLEQLAKLSFRYKKTII